MPDVNVAKASVAGVERIGRSGWALEIVPAHAIRHAVVLTLTYVVTVMSVWGSGAYPPAILGAGIVHALLAALLATLSLEVLGSKGGRRAGDPVGVWLMLHAFYFIGSTLKPFGDQEWMFVVLDHDLQLLGTTVGAVILCGLVLAYLSRGPGREEGGRGLLALPTPGMHSAAVWLGAATIALQLLLLAVGYGSSYSGAAYSGGAVRQYLDNVGLTFLQVTRPGFWVIGIFVLLSGRGSTWVRIVLGGLLLWDLGLTVGLLKVRRWLFLMLALVCAHPVIGGQRWGKRLRLGIFLLLPCVGIVGDAITQTLGRENTASEKRLDVVIAATTSRLDLTDYGVLIAVSGPMDGWRHLSEGAKWAVPRFLWPEKTGAELDQYSRMLMQVGLENGDYPDSIFSAGAMAAGWPGFVLVPVIYFGLLSALHAVMAWQGRQGVSRVLLVAVFAWTGVEIELWWGSLIPHLRLMLVLGTAITVVISARAILRALLPGKVSKRRG